jgi:NitT/TauT family transport system substrate-binding protein
MKVSKIGDMSFRVGTIAVATVLVAALTLVTAGISSAQTKITVGRTISSSGFHIPSYVAMYKGFFKKEGLAAKFVSMNGKALLNAGIAKAIDFVPIPGGGSQASLKGAPLRYVVGQSLISQWVLATPKSIMKVEDLKGKTIGLDRPGNAGYDETEIVLGEHFGMEVGRDYKVISFRSEGDRVAALINGSIQAAAVTFAHAAKAKVAGFKVLMKLGQYLPRVGGTFWTHADYLKKNRATVKKFIRAMAKAEQYMVENKEGTVDVIHQVFKMKDRREAVAIYEEVFDQYGPDIPEDLFFKLFNSRRTRMVSKGLWDKDKPLPNIEQFIARDLLTETLREMGYYLQAPPKL